MSELQFPSGLAGNVRAMKVREERVLSDRKLSKAGSQLEELLGACWETTVEPGPYDFGDKPIDWGSVLQGDRFFALLSIRALTYGPDYGFASGRQRSAFVLTAAAFVRRLVALVPPHLTSFHGVFAPHAASSRFAL
jgi:hypothetical protein